MAIDVSEADWDKTEIFLSLPEIVIQLRERLKILEVANATLDARVSELECQLSELRSA